jgi:hypothetical protein
MLRCFRIRKRSAGGLQRAHGRIRCRSVRARVSRDQREGMRVRKAATKQGTAADSAKASDGYVASGESSYSRRAAHPDHVRLPSYKNTKHGPRSNASHLRYQRTELERLQRKAGVEHNPGKLEKLRKNIEAKTQFVARLEREEQELAEGVETIHGADEFEKWSDI